MRRAATLGDEIGRRGLTKEQAAVLGGVQPSTVLRIIKGQVRARPVGGDKNPGREGSRRGSGGRQRPCARKKLG